MIIYKNKCRGTFAGGSTYTAFPWNCLIHNGVIIFAGGRFTSKNELRGTLLWKLRNVMNVIENENGHQFRKISKSCQRTQAIILYYNPIKKISAAGKTL